MSTLTRCAWYPVAALALAACGPADTIGPRLPASALADAPPASAFSAAALLEEDFGGALLDPLKWKVETRIPQERARVLADAGHAILVNRGHLVTVAEFPPAPLGGIGISGDWTFAGAADDFIQILTRSDGLPDPRSPYGETGQGIEFIAFTSAVWENPNAMYIQGKGGALGTVTLTGDSGSLVLNPGGTYHFTVTDDGHSVRFILTDPADPSQSRIVTATSPYAGAANHVTFHNREFCCLGSHRAYLDNVRIFGGVQ